MSDDRLDRMGAFDAVMWGVEQDPLLRSVIVAMTVLDARPDIDVLVDRITRMTLAVPKLRQRVIGNPVSPIPPRWEVDPNFDLAFHLKRFHVPADGTDRPLCGSPSRWPSRTSTGIARCGRWRWCRDGTATGPR